MERRATGTALILLAAACGGEPPAPARPPPRDVLALSIRVEHSDKDMFCPSLELGLTRSGLTVTSDSAQPADATLTCISFAREEASAFRIVVNGETQMSIAVRIEVRGPDNRIVDRFVAEYSGYKSRAPDGDAVNKAVLAFAYSPRIASFARAVKTGAYANATAQPLGTAPPIATVEGNPTTGMRDMRDQRDERDWVAIETVKCKIPARVEACNSLRQYIVHHPQGAHVQEATEILAAAQPALEKLQRDDVAWQKANRNDCASRRTPDACVGVEAYEMQFSSGVHADEARRLLKAAGVK
jgi:hypothetical protein